MTPIGLVRIPAAMMLLSGGAWAADEIVPSTEARDIAEIIATIEGGINAAYAVGARPAMRDAHAKAHGCVRATFTVGADLPQAARVGVFAQPHPYRAWIRFSNGAGTPHDDSAGDGRGMAIKLTGVPGEKLLADEANAQTQDFVMINYPVFFIRNVADYVPFTALTLRNRASEFLVTHPHEAVIVKAITAKTVDDVLEQRYFSMAPSRLGDRAIKFSARPVQCASGAPIAESDAPAPQNSPDYLRSRMISWLGDKDACFRFGVQFQTDPATQPIEDPTILWDEAKAPFLDVASIHIPRQRFDSAAQQSFCESLSFTPWHALPEHRPIGGINRLRKAVYQAISTLRHGLNKVSRAEPTGTETFD